MSSGTGPSQFPRDVVPDASEAKPPSDEQDRAEAKLRELEEARRSGALSEEEYQDQARRLRSERGQKE